MRAKAPVRLLRPLWLALVAVAVAAALLIVHIAGASLRQRTELVRQERFLHAAQTLKVAVEGALTLGLPLEQLPRMQDMLEREQAATPGSLSIEIFDLQGRVLFGTDRSFLGDLVSERWLQLAGAGGTAAWHGEDDLAQVVGAPVVNGFGAVLGHVAVRYPRITENDLPTLPLPAMIAVAAALTAFAAVLAALLRRHYRDLGANLAAARHVLLAGEPPDDTAPLLAQLAGSARTRVHERLNAMDAALLEARRIDEHA